MVPHYFSEVVRQLAHPSMTEDKAIEIVSNSNWQVINDMLVNDFVFDHRNYSWYDTALESITERADLELSLSVDFKSIEFDLYRRTLSFQGEIHVSARFLERCWPEVVGKLVVKDSLAVASKVLWSEFHKWLAVRAKDFKHAIYIEEGNDLTPDLDNLLEYFRDDEHEKELTHVATYLEARHHMDPLRAAMCSADLLTIIDLLRDEANEDWPTVRQMIGNWMSESLDHLDDDYEYYSSADYVCDEIRNDFGTFITSVRAFAFSAGITYEEEEQDHE